MSVYFGNIIMSGCRMDKHGILYITKIVLHIHKHTYFGPVSNRFLYDKIFHIWKLNIDLQTLHLHLHLHIHLQYFQYCYQNPRPFLNKNII